MQVVYSVGSRLGRSGGIGVTAYNAARGIYRHGYLKRLLASSIAPGVQIDRSLCRSMGLAGRALTRIAALDLTSGVCEATADWSYDLFARWHVEPSDVFHGWGLHCLFSLRRAKDLGAITVVERASSHILTQERLLQEEYATFGLKSKPIPRVAIERSLQEFEEADYVIVPSQFVVDSFLEHNYPASKLILNPFGVDLDRFRPADNCDGMFRVLFLGQIGLRKGVQYLLQAWAGLGLKRAELVLAGNVGADIRALVNQYGELPGVRFIGHVDNLNDVYASGDLFVFPSIEEGSALVTYEAMACGLPVVLTPNAGSVARDGIDGFIVPIRDVDALKEKIVYLHKNEEARREMGRAARRRVEEYTWERYGDRLVDSYRRILATRQGTTQHILGRNSG